MHLFATTKYTIIDRVKYKQRKIEDQNKTILVLVFFKYENLKL